MMLKFINISGINQYLSHINFNNFNKLSVCNTNVFFQINCFGPPPNIDIENRYYKSKLLSKLSIDHHKKSSDSFTAPQRHKKHKNKTYFFNF